MDDSEIDFRSGRIALSESLVNFDFAESDANVILILEKDSVFQCLLDEKFLEIYPKTILITVCNFFNNYYIFDLPKYFLLTIFHVIRKNYFMLF